MMDCPTCGPVPHQLQHDLTRCRLVCRTCGYQHPWMTADEGRAMVDVAIAVLRGLPGALRATADAAAAERTAA